MVGGVVDEVGVVDLVVESLDGEDGDATGEGEEELFHMVVGCLNSMEDIEIGWDIWGEVVAPEEDDGLGVASS